MCRDGKQHTAKNNSTMLTFIILILSYTRRQKFKGTFCMNVNIEGKTSGNLKIWIYGIIFIPGEEQEHCKLDSIVPESDLGVTKLGRLTQSPASRKIQNFIST